ncbi:hypothetical protein B7P43_G10257 [Cryptotermes secundus]|uniref:Uncharacterized protein n=1 Tax=Cryptotermes secundus TaxID=105785 RepID=A0A2J7PEB0_9NEOP|nr:hypothetical protein B7P43_G10257 [Cryptotermes secundus]
MKLAAACRKVSRRATVAWRKSNILRNSTQVKCGPRHELAADKKMTSCANVTQHKRLGLQGDQLESRTSPHKDLPKKV